MSLTQVDIDDDALAEAMRLSGARTKKDTVNLALRAYTEHRRRVDSIERFAELARGWDYDGWLRMREADKRPGP